MTANQILVTPRSVTSGGHPSLARFEAAGYEVLFCEPGRQPTEEELVQLLPGCVGYLAGVEQVSGKVLRSAVDLRAISRNGTGVDNVDLDAAAANQVAVLRAEGANARGVAELALGLIFSLSRSITPSDAALKDQSWKRAKGIELADRKLGIVGCGKIGRLLAEMALGIGMEVLAYDLFQDDSYRPSDRFGYTALENILSMADIISLHCPPPADGSPLIDEHVLSQMKKGVLIVNTARAGLIDEAAAMAALESGQLGGLATDVFDPEPPTDFTLVSHPGVIGTPHIGGFTKESVDRAMDAAVDNLLAHLANG